jgi:hypothetical protein
MRLSYCNCVGVLHANAIIRTYFHQLSCFVQGHYGRPEMDCIGWVRTLNLGCHAIRPFVRF